MQVERHGTYSLPQTFSDRGTAIAIHYELVAIVDHGKLRASRKYADAFIAPTSSLKTPCRVKTQLCYVPKTVAGAPSRARARAYRHGVPPPGPAEDPRGWCTLEPAVTRGRIFDKRDVEARYIVRPRTSQLRCELTYPQLSLASPVSHSNAPPLSQRLTWRLPSFPTPAAP